MLFELVPDPWHPVLNHLKEEINEIGKQLQARADRGERILPDKRYVFRALETPPEAIKVVIVGQDPYPNIADAIGLAFSVSPRNSGLPGSLMNIQKEILTDIGSTTTSDGDLTRWSAQGVLLLNRVLTVSAGNSGSHADLGWQKITHQIVQHVANLKAVGVLWGNTARELAPLFEADSLVEGVHPSPLSAHRGFLGSKPFSRVNEILKSRALPEINW
ncbi:MAG: uracil-DNA glycosylase [Candidatus Nanopelagicaceae bacterium]|nr:uracil-DNA glycosylase [Candidatus Nanopelagicaceae bacterium]